METSFVQLVRLQEFIPKTLENYSLIIKTFFNNLVTILCDNKSPKIKLILLIPIKVMT